MKRRSNLPTYPAAIACLFWSLSCYVVSKATEASAETKPVISYFERGMQSFIGTDLGVPQDYNEAVKWFRLAADQRDARAQYRLGQCFAYSWGVERNYDEAVKWLRLAAAQNLPEAQYELSRRYASGDGVIQNTIEALKYLRQAAEQGFVDAQTTLGQAFDLGWLFRETVSVEKNFVESAKWFRRAAELGDARSQSWLGQLYGAGRGVPKDDKEAVRWLRMAAAQGHMYAYKSLGDHYLNGKGVPRDAAEAVRWYRRSAAEELSSNQYPLGILMLGYVYETGTGVNQDYVEAYAYYSLAAAAGDQEARKLRDVVAATYLRGSLLIAAQQRAREIQVELAAEKAKANGSGQKSAATPQPASVDGALPSNVKATGSGFAVAARGLVVTNWHVIEGAARIELVTARGVVAANVLASDPSNDLAILRADKPLPAALSIWSSRGLKLGTEIFTIGFPNPELQGFSPKFTRGDISSLAGAGDDPRYFQISVPIQPGNSGGALCDMEGRVVGVVAARLSTQTTLKMTGSLPENVNYAIKSSYLLALLESLDLPSGTLAPDSNSKVTADDARARAQQAAVLVIVY
jgi:uncharacterized protein